MTYNARINLFLHPKRYSFQIFNINFFKYLNSFKKIKCIIRKSDFGRIDIFFFSLILLKIIYAISSIWSKGHSTFRNFWNGLLVKIHASDTSGDLRAAWCAVHLSQVAWPCSMVHATVPDCQSVDWISQVRGSLLRLYPEPLVTYLLSDQMHLSSLTRPDSQLLI